MKKNVLFIFLLFIGTGLAAQHVTISGKAASYTMQPIGVWENLDFISNLQKQLTTDSVQKDGSFILEFDIRSIRYITLKIGKNIASMYVQPGTNYEIIIYPPDSTTYQNPNLEHDVKISINLKSRTEINALTLDYDKRFDDFLGVEYKSFVARTPLPKIDSFRLAMHSFYSTVSEKYFQAYIDYTIAAMEEETKASDKALYKKYISGHPVLYHHPEYMHFFNAFYHQKLQSMAMSRAGNSLDFIINNRGSAAATLEVMKHDPFLTNDTICELVMLKGLYEGYYDGSFNRQSVVSMLRQVADSGHVSENRQIAQNMLHSFSRLQKGTAAPDFNLPDKTGATHSLNSLLEKKFIYIVYFDEDCSSCIAQLKVLPALKKTYGARIEFVAISTAKTNKELQEFLAKNPKYDWLFLYDNTGDQLREAYEIRSFPAYFLVGPDGRFIQVPAESPDENIEKTFFDLTKIKSKLHNVGSKTN